MKAGKETKPQYFASHFNNNFHHSQIVLFVLFSGGKIHDNSLNRSVEISEIDARLNALQQYMKENMD